MENYYDYECDYDYESETFYIDPYETNSLIEDAEKDLEKLLDTKLVNQLNAVKEEESDLNCLTIDLNSEISALNNQLDEMDKEINTYLSEEETLFHDYANDFFNKLKDELYEEKFTISKDFDLSSDERVEFEHTLNENDKLTLIKVTEHSEFKTISNLGFYKRKVDNNLKECVLSYGIKVNKEKEYICFSRQIEKEYKPDDVYSVDEFKLMGINALPYFTSEKKAEMAIEKIKDFSPNEVCYGIKKNSLLTVWDFHYE